MVADGLSGAVKFATFEVSKIFLEKKLPVKFHPSLQFICAAGAMVACSFIMVPGEVIKIRLQAGLCNSMTEGISQTLKLDGFGGLFAGKKTMKGEGTEADGDSEQKELLNVDIQFVY